MSSNNIRWLTTVPASDGNFKLHLQYATLEELKESVSILTEKGTKGNIARINALNREIRKRCKKLESKRIGKRTNENEKMDKWLKGMRMIESEE